MSLGLMVGIIVAACAVVAGMAILQLPAWDRGSGKNDEAKPLRVCHWSEEEDMWETECKHAFVLNEGTPSENEMRFCSYCGGELIEVRMEEER